MQFKAFEPGIEVSGKAVYSTLDGLKSLKIPAENDLLNIGIGKNGILAIDLDKWYSQESWLKIFEVIAMMYGDSILFKIGFSIPETAIFPQLGNSIEDAVTAIDIAYHMNHKKNNTIMYDEKNKIMLDGIGHYGCNKIKDHNLIVSVCNNPYPCSFDKGILTATIKRLKPNAIAYHDDSKPCRKNGADSCSYIITW